jgi:hypothetical protein
MTARTWTLDVPAPGPWLNSNDRSNRYKVARIAKLWREAAQVRARDAGLPMLSRCHITAELRFTDNRRRDDHNYQPTIKPLIDGLVDYGLLPDDSRQYLTGVELRGGEPIRKVPYGPVGAVHLIITEVV